MDGHPELVVLGLIIISVLAAVYTYHTLVAAVSRHIRIEGLDLENGVVYVRNVGSEPVAVAALYVLDGDRVAAYQELNILIAPGESKALRFEPLKENGNCRVKVEAYTVKLLNKVSVEASG